jgi:hypothetical protein
MTDNKYILAPTHEECTVLMTAVQSTCEKTSIDAANEILVRVKIVKDPQITAEKGV